MENFDVVQALVKTALGGDRGALLHQVERLEARLREQGETSSAATLKRLGSRAASVQAVEPLNFVMSGVAAANPPKLQRLGVSTPLPVDRDSGVVLCEVAFPSPDLRMPRLDGRSLLAVEGLIEEWAHRSKLERAGLPPSSSLLLYGAPGTGKTSLAIYLASRLGLPAVVARLDGLISSLLGNTARNLATLFDFANRYETVFILDEFDAVAKVRDDPNEVGEIKRVVNALLQNLDRRAMVGLTVGITNHELLLDTAIWRRFEHQIHLELPNFTTRKLIVQDLFKGIDTPSGFSKVVAWATEGQAGADVRTFAISSLKSLILASESLPRPVDAMRAAAIALGDRVGGKIATFADASDPDLARKLSSDIGELTGSELAAIFGKDRRTISRWVQGGEQ